MQKSTYGHSHGSYGEMRLASHQRHESFKTQGPWIWQKVVLVDFMITYDYSFGSIYH